MKLVVSCFLLAYSIGFLDGQDKSFRCDYKLYEEAGGYFKYHQMPANWHEAQLRCYMEGTVLLSPLDNLLIDVMKRIMVHHSTVRGVFTGIHSSFSRGDFFSIEGVPLSQIPLTWATGEPDNFKDEEGCIAMLPNGKLADNKCAIPLPYICYAKKTTGMSLNECGTTDNEYKLDKRTGSCYKYHRYPRTWSRGFMTCAAEGGYLIIINSEIEAEVVRNLMKKNPNIDGVGEYRHDVVNIGVSDWNEHGEWRTVHGHKLSEVYSKFAWLEPNNLTMQYCLASYRSGLLDDTWCDKRAAYICEKDPKSVPCMEDTDN